MTAEQTIQNAAKPEISLSVKDIVTFVIRSGSIDSRMSGRNRALEGARIHRKLQAEAEQGYRAEVTLKKTIETDNAIYHIQGRADGIIVNMAGVTVDEIKTVSRDIDTMTEDDYPEYWAQAKFYAAIVAELEGLAAVNVRLTYYHITTKVIRRFNHLYTTQELALFVNDTVKEYDRFIALKTHHLTIRNKALDSVTFPFPAYRKGQKEMMTAVYRTIINRNLLLCEAPTGIGKTMASLFGGLKAMANSGAKSLFYATAKTTQKQNAEKALKRLETMGASNLTVTITAKDEICPMENRECTPEACPRAKDHFSRVNPPLYDAMQASGIFDRRRIEAICDAHRLCPFEFALELSHHADVVIGDYNYLFDPVIGESSLSDELFSKIVLIDEAHNLVDRVRSMYTVSLKRSAFNAVKKKLTAKDKKIKSAITALTAVFKKTADSRHEKKWVSRDNLNDVNNALNAFARECDSRFAEGGETPEELSELYFDVRRYLTVNEYYDAAFVITVDTSGRDIIISERCIDPKNAIAGIMKNTYGGVLFSATLTPKSYYQRLFGLADNSYRLTLSSPFNRENLICMVADGIETTYKKRDLSYEPIAKMIKAAVSGKTGHYVVFFPSYAYMRAVVERFDELYPDAPIIVQSPGMNETEKETFLSAFYDHPDDLLVGFCVLGGYFAEGIDLTGKALIGAVIVGVGLPKVGDEQNLIRDYHNALSENGFDYAYRFPGITKVFQAMGRVIRDENDRGILLLIDKRYTYRDYRSLLASHDKDFTFVKNEAEVKAIVTSFWDNQKKREDDTIDVT